MGCGHNAGGFGLQSPVSNLHSYSLFFVRTSSVINATPDLDMCGTLRVHRSFWVPRAEV